MIIEKPFGHDLASAKELDRVVSEVFDPSSVFRIDHYLGKETVQNMLALRFANAMYEPIWNANYVDHVQITMAEDIGIGGRAGYYDGIGAARDVIQNHLLQLMALTAMEEPVSFTASDLTAEKTKILSAVRLPKDLAAHTARGQYAAGWQGSHDVVGYLEEKGIDPASTTETYAAIRLDIDTRRWAGVPFYLRTGKRLGKRVTEIAVVFKRAPHLPFESTATRELGKNAIVIRVQPDEGVTIRFGSKVPGGTAMEVRDVSMDFSYGRSFTESSPEAYERLILDVLLGDRRCSRPPKRSTCRGRSSTRSRNSGPRSVSRSRIVPARGGRRRPMKCSHATDATGGCHDYRNAEHPHPRDCAQNRTAARGARRIGDRPRADAAHRHRGRGPRACAGNRELGQP